MNVSARTNELIRKSLQYRFDLIFIAPDRLPRLLTIRQRVALVIVGSHEAAIALDLLERIKVRFSATPAIFLPNIESHDDVCRAASLNHITVIKSTEIGSELEAAAEQLLWRKGLFGRMVQLNMLYVPLWLRAWFFPVPQIRQLSQIYHNLRAGASMPEAVPSGATTPSFLRKKKHLHITYFGPFQLKFHKTVLSNFTKKERSLLAYLFFKMPKRIHKDQLMEEFWPDRAPASARNSLNVAIYHLRQKLKRLIKGDVIVFDNDQYYIHPDLKVETDIHRFLQHYQQGMQCFNRQDFEGAKREFGRAFELYQDDFLPEIVFESGWVDHEKISLREKYLRALDLLSQHHHDRQNWKQAIQYSRMLLDKDPCWENVHVRLMRCYYFSGNKAQAVRQYHECVHQLAEGLNVSPSPKTRQLYLKIKEGEL